MASSTRRGQGGQGQARRHFLLGALGATILLAGCQTGRQQPRLPGGGTGPVRPVAPVDGPRNLVAVIVPTSGGDGAIGQSIANAANLALADSGDKTLRITVYNSAGTGGAAAAATRAIADGNRLILGPLLANDVRAAAPIARRAGVPIVAFSNDEGVAGDGVYLMGFTPDQSIDRVVSYARSTGKGQFAALVPSGLYGQRATQAMLGAVRKSGGRITVVEPFDRSPASVRAAAARLRGKGKFDAVLIADSGRMAALAAPSLPRAAKFMGTELWASDKTLGKTVALRGAWYAAAPDARFNQLTVRYRARYGRSPYRLASMGYDAVLLAVRSARNWPVGRPFPARGLTDKDGFSGVDGNFRFGRDGIAERLLEVRQVTATGTITVSPAGRAF